jgi:hypothetical protein
MAELSDGVLRAGAYLCEIGRPSEEWRAMSDSQSLLTDRFAIRTCSASLLTERPSSPIAIGSFASQIEIGIELPFCCTAEE